MVRIRRFHRSVDEWRLHLASCARLRADAEQVRRGEVEIQRAAVDDLVLEQALRVPLREFVVAQVGDLLAQARLDVVGSQREIEQDAPHAFALERKRSLVVARFAAPRQAFGDPGLGRLELPAVDERDDLGDGGIVGAFTRPGAGCDEQEQRQDRARTGTCRALPAAAPGEA